jgi:hypothetical protein
MTEQISKRLDLNEGWRIVMVDKVFAERGGRAGCMGYRRQECQTFATHFSRESPRRKTPEG